MKRLFHFIRSLRRLILLLSMVISSCAVFSQNSNIITKATVNLREIVQIKTQRPLSEQIDAGREMPEHEAPRPHRPATRNIHYAKEPKEHKSLGQPSPTAVLGFASKPYDGYYPPDPHGAVNGDFVVGTVNDELYIQDRSGNLILDISLSHFWSVVGVTHRLFDPRLVYDPATQRWFLVTAANAGTDTSCILVAATQSDDPTAGWNIYRVKADSVGERWADYPNIGFNKNWVAVTVNLFSDTSSYSDTGRIYLLNKSDLMNNRLSPVKTFDIDQGLIPAVTYDSSMNDLYFLEVYSEPAGQLQMLKVSGAIGAETIASAGYPAVAMTWAPTPYNYADFGPQLGDTNKIQCNDDRMGNVVVRNNVIWCTHTVFLPADTDPTRSSVLWWAIDTNADVLQHGLIDDTSGKTFYAFPSIAVNTYNDALIGYSVFSPQQYPAAGYTYHDHAQFPGSMNNPYIFVNSDTTYYRSASNRNRWGDCSATVVDPLNDIDFWTINEYVATANNWGSWWAYVRGSDAIDNNPASTSFTVILAPNPNNGNFNLYFTEQANGPAQIEIYDVIGHLVFNKNTEPEINSIGINIPLSQGLYVARIKVNGMTIEKKMVVDY